MCIRPLGGRYPSPFCRQDPTTAGRTWDLHSDGKAVVRDDAERVMQIEIEGMSVCVCVHVYVCACMYVCMCVCMCVCVCVFLTFMRHFLYAVEDANMI